MMGSRFLLLHHVGRKSGRAYRTPVEVAHFAPETGTYLVASAYGSAADWYRNVRANPDVFIEVGRETLAARAEPLGAEESGAAMEAYAREHPIVAPLLARTLGLPVPKDLEGYRKLGADMLPFVAFHTRR
jgi:deazaflavin-dependent oxidoreductase (nitroreductase family)